MNTENNFLQFENVGFTYPVIAGDTDKDGNPILPKPVYDNFSANLPGGFVHLVGPNASGKSTFMLLASGRLCPQKGLVKIFGTETKKFFTPQSFDVATKDGKTAGSIMLDMPNQDFEEEKNSLSSFVYQNMEFDTDDKVSKLLNFVFENGNHSKKEKSFFDDVIKIASLDSVLEHKLTGISKGETQRVLFAFSVLYGSKSIFMDEPFFAMEQKQKEAALEYLRDYSKTRNIPIYISMHDLDLSRKYAENILLFYPDRTMEFGTPQEILTQEALEKSYGVPVAMLRDTETLTRKQIEERENAKN